MKRLLQNIRTWPGNFDLMTDAFYIEEDRNPVEKERKETEMKDIVKTIVEVMIIIAIVTVVAVITAPPTHAATKDTAKATVQEDVGNGVFYLSNGSGSTENGDKITVLPDKGFIPYAWMDVELYELDKEAWTYFVIDGKVIAKEVMGPDSMTSVPLQKKAQIKKGTHTIEVIQKEGKEVTFHRSAEYTVK